MWLVKLKVIWFYWFFLFESWRFSNFLVMIDNILQLSSEILQSWAFLLAYHHPLHHHHRKLHVFPHIHYFGFKMGFKQFFVFLTPINFMLIVHRLGYRYVAIKINIPCGWDSRAQLSCKHLKIFQFLFFKFHRIIIFDNPKLLKTIFYCRLWYPFWCFLCSSNGHQYIYILVAEEFSLILGSLTLSCKML